MLNLSSLLNSLIASSLLKKVTPDSSAMEPDAFIIGAWSRKNRVEFVGIDSSMTLSSEKTSIELLSINFPVS